MKALILAAGEAARLGPISNGLPKLFLEVNSKTIYDYQIEALEGYCDEVLVVLGYGFDSASNRSPNGHIHVECDLEVNSIVLDDWNDVENAVSCERGLRRLTNTDNIFILCGDILLTSKVVEVMVDTFYRKLKPENFSAVGAVEGEQEKMTAVNWDKNGTITDYGDITGHREAGCFILHKNHVSDAINILSKHPNQWFPIIFPRVPTRRVLIPEDHQYEINLPQHYHRVERCFQH